jgi:hypothetical protein
MIRASSGLVMLLQPVNRKTIHAGDKNNRKSLAKFNGTITLIGASKNLKF